MLFIHGIGSSGSAWQEIIEGLPSHIRVITIDLLGFGDSPRPAWATYNARTQARSVFKTVLRQGLSGRLIVVGHSLGALVAIELAKRYPYLLRALIICSPPFYDQYDKKTLLPKSDKILRSLYQSALKRPDQLVKLSAYALRYGLVHPTFNLTNENIHGYMSALESIILNQSSLQDAYSLRVPTTIIRGSFDPLVIGKHVKNLAKHNPEVELRTIIAGHDITGRYVPAITQAIEQAAEPPKSKK